MSCKIGLRHSIGFILLILLVEGCASRHRASPKIQTIAPATRYTLAGYSVLSPNESGWIVVEKNDSHIVFGKQSYLVPDTRAALVADIPFSRVFKDPVKFLEFVKEGQIKGSDPKRFRILKHEEVLDNRYGPFCVKHYMKVEDHGINGTNSSLSAFVILEAYGYTFLTSHLPGRLVTLGYSKRYPLRTESEITPAESLPDRAPNHVGNIFISSWKEIPIPRSKPTETEK